MVLRLPSESTKVKANYAQGDPRVDPGAALLPVQLPVNVSGNSVKDAQVLEPLPPKWGTHMRALGCGVLGMGQGLPHPTCEQAETFVLDVCSSHA